MWLASKIMAFTVPTFITIYICTTHQYTNFVPKISNFDQIGYILPRFAQNSPNLCKYSASSVMKSPDHWTKICEKASQKAGTYK